MAKAPAWEPPMDPDFEKLAREGWSAFQRDRPSLVAWDTETSGLEWSDDAFCLTAAWYTASGDLEAHYFELALPEALEAAQSVLRVSEWVGHNLKFDVHRAINGGLVPKEYLDHVSIHDTEALAHLDDEHRLKGLKYLAVELLGIQEETVAAPTPKNPERRIPRETYEMDKAKKWAKKEYGLASVKDVGYHLLPRGVVVPYAIKDAEYTLRLYTYLRPRIERFPDTAWAKYLQEMETTRVFLDMEGHGLGVDEPYVEEQIKVYSRKVLMHEMEIEGIVGKPVRTGKMPEKEKPLYFNPQSNDQIRDFFTAAGFERDNYDVEVLKDIEHPLAAKLLDLRGDAKILNTYFRSLRKGTVDGVFHPSIRQHGTVTGRTSSGAERGDS